MDVTQEPLPDLLTMDLADLERVQHPVLTELLAELTERAGHSGEVFWGFESSL